MPIVNSSYYSNSPTNLGDYNDELSNIQNDNYTYENNNISDYDIQDIIYANTTEGITARKIYDKFVKQVPEIVGSCGLDEAFFLNALEDEITMFTAMGHHKWNFLSVEQNISLNGQNRHYVLPSHFDQMIACWINTNSPLNNTGRKLEILEIDEEKKNFTNGINFYSRKGYQLEFINLNWISHKTWRMKNCPLG